MTEATRKTPQIKAPAWLSRSEKLAFRRVLDGMSGRQNALKPHEVDAIADLVSARSRIAYMRGLLASYERETHFRGSEAKILALGRQIDATTKLATTLAEQIHAVA